MDRLDRLELTEQLDSMVQFHQDKAIYYIDWLNEEQSHRVDQIVQHSQYLISEKELEEIEENEASLSRIIRA